MGFGESTERYGCSADSPISSLGQGSGASPPAFMALSSLIVNSYCRLGHGAKISSSYAAWLFWLSAWCTWTTPTCYTGWSHPQLILRNWLLMSRWPPLMTGNLHKLPVVSWRQKSAQCIFWNTSLSVAVHVRSNYRTSRLHGCISPKVMPCIQHTSSFHSRASRKCPS